MNKPANKGYFAQGLFGRDLLASVVVFLVALPLCMGVAIASGMPPASGLITGIIGGLVVGVIAGSPLQVSGPAAGMAVLVFELVRQHGVAALGPVVLVAGAIQLVAGLCRVGVWFRMTSPAVVAGMLSGIGILIVASQSHVLMDATPAARGLENFAALPAVLWRALSEGVGLTALLIGLATIAITAVWNKLRLRNLRFLPGALVGAVTVTLVAQWLALDVKKVDVPSNLFSTINLPGVSDILGVFVSAPLLLAAITFAFVASAETLLSAAAVDRMHQGPRTQYERELGAQGIGNMLCGLLGALPMTGVIVRSAANVQAGGMTRMSAILHGGWLLVFAMLLPWLLRMTPVACLAGILVYTGIKMVDVGQLKKLAVYGRGTVLIFVVTTLAIVATDLLTGVIVGFVLSLLRLAVQSSRLKLDVQEHGGPGKLRLSLVGSATFLGVPSMARTLESVPPNTELHLDVARLTHVDHACLELLRDWGRNAATHGSQLVVDWQELDRRTEGPAKAAA